MRNEWIVKPPDKKTRALARMLNKQGSCFREVVVTAGNDYDVIHRGFCMFSFREHDDTEDFLCAVQDLNMEHKETAK